MLHPDAYKQLKQQLSQFLQLLDAVGDMGVSIVDARLEILKIRSKLKEMAYPIEEPKEEEPTKQLKDEETGE